MNSTDRIFVSIIKNYINQTKCEENVLTDVDMEELNELAKIHKLSGMCYSSLKNVVTSPGQLKYMEMGFYAQLALYQKRSMVKMLVKELLDSNEIEHIWIKGSHIATSYPDPELRTMSDLDIVIEAKNREKFHELIIGKGAKYKMEDSDETVRVYRIYDINLEIHTHLVSTKNFMNGVDYGKYFADAFDHKVSVGGYSYILEEEYNILYLMFHIAKHFYGHGCGIRMLLDFPMLIRNSNNINWDSVWEKLDKLELAGFADRVFRLCEEWFGQFGVEHKKEIEFDNMELIEDYIISGGVYGFEGRNNDAVQIKRKGTNRNGEYSYAKGVINWAFPSYKEMRQYSLWFQGKPAVLLPIAYAERFVRNVKERGGIVKLLKRVMNGQREMDEKQIILNVMDLK